MSPATLEPLNGPLTPKKMGDVFFTYTSGGRPATQTLLWANRIASREGLGLWHVGNQAWKVYSTRAQYAALSADYRRASVDAGLPMGNPSFQQGSVRRGTGRPTEGFVLITEWMVGTTFLHNAGSFQTALTREAFPKSGTDYTRHVCLSGFSRLEV